MSRAALAIVLAGLLLAGCGSKPPAPCSPQWISNLNASMAYLDAHSAGQAKQAITIAGQVTGTDMAIICRGNHA